MRISRYWTVPFVVKLFQNATRPATAGHWPRWIATRHAVPERMGHAVDRNYGVPVFQHPQLTRLSNARVNQRSGNSMWVPSS